MPTRILYFAGTHGDWGGASRVLFTNLALLDRSRFEPIVLLDREGPGRAILDAAGITCEVWGPMTDFNSPFGYVRAVIRTALWLWRRKIDLIHVNRSVAWRPAELIAAWIARIPVVTHFHVVNRDRAPGIRMATAIAAVSRFVAEHSDCQGVPTHVIHNAVDVNRFSSGDDIRGELGLPNDATVVTFVGQIRRIKGIDLFVEAARKIKGDQVRFLVTGECRKGRGIDDALTTSDLMNLIEVDKRIVYAGYRADMPDIYRSSDVIVMPSRWAEPFGLVAIEAGAAGKPVVTTRVGGIPEVIIDGTTGFLADSVDAATLADRIQALVNSRELREAMGSAARERVEAEFTSKPVRKLEALYESLLLTGNRRGRRRCTVS